MRSHRGDVIGVKKKTGLHRKERKERKGIDANKIYKGI
jgi:hypothetical protein